MARKNLLKGKPVDLARKYKKVLLESGVPVDELILFGSHAKKSARYDSDLDICVVSPIFGKKPFEEMMKLGRIALKVDSMIEPHPYNPKDFKNKYDPLASEIKKTGIKIT